MKIKTITDPSVKEFKPFTLEITLDTVEEANLIWRLTIDQCPEIAYQINDEYYRQWGYSPHEVKMIKEHDKSRSK